MYGGAKTLTSNKGDETMAKKTAKKAKKKTAKTETPATTPAPTAAADGVKGTRKGTTGNLSSYIRGLILAKTDIETDEVKKKCLRKFGETVSIRDCMGTQLYNQRLRLIRTGEVDGKEWFTRAEISRVKAGNGISGRHHAPKEDAPPIADDEKTATKHGRGERGGGGGGGGGGSGKKKTAKKKKKAKKTAADPMTESPTEAKREAKKAKMKTAKKEKTAAAIPAAE